MVITLEPAVEQRLQAELASGRYTSASDFIASALDVLEDVDEGEGTFSDEFVTMLDQRSAAAERGEWYTEEEARRLLAVRRAAKHAR